MVSPPDEIKESLGHLNDEETSSLIEKCEALIEYQESVLAAAKKANPERFREVTEQYLQEMQEENEAYLNDMEELQKQADEELDKAEESAIYEMSSAVKEFERGSTETVEQAKQVQEDLDKAFQEKLKSSN